ncbi:MAG TPA: hypothetical protein VKZ96_19025 [Thermomicrobiales bacterium]|nr:hypothetical protein [Thermomicrobiales bacterium]
MNAYPTRQEFAAQLGSQFRVDLGDGESLDLTLAEVNDLGERREGDKVIESFSLIFEGPPDILLHQHIFTVSHPDLGEHQIFLVPLGPEGGVLQYEAIFN